MKGIPEGRKGEKWGVGEKGKGRREKGRQISLVQGFEFFLHCI